MGKKNIRRELEFNFLEPLECCVVQCESMLGKLRRMQAMCESRFGLPESGRAPSWDTAVRWSVWDDMLGNMVAEMEAERDGRPRRKKRVA